MGVRVAVGRAAGSSARPDGRASHGERFLILDRSELPERLTGVFAVLAGPAGWVDAARAAIARAFLSSAVLSMREDLEERYLMGVLRQVAEGNGPDRMGSE